MLVIIFFSSYNQTGLWNSEACLRIELNYCVTSHSCECWISPGSVSLTHFHVSNISKVENIIIMVFYARCLWREQCKTNTMHAQDCVMNKILHPHTLFPFIPTYFLSIFADIFSYSLITWSVYHIDSGWHYDHQSRQSRQITEQDGLLGNGSFPRRYNMDTKLGPLVQRWEQTSTINLHDLTM